MNIPSFRIFYFCIKIAIGGSGIRQKRFSARGQLGQWGQHGHVHAQFEQFAVELQHQHWFPLRPFPEVFYGATQIFCEPFQLCCLGQIRFFKEKRSENQKTTLFNRLSARQRKNNGHRRTVLVTPKKREESVRRRMEKISSLQMKGGGEESYDETEGSEKLVKMIILF